MNYKVALRARGSNIKTIADMKGKKSASPSGFMRKKTIRPPPAYIEGISPMPE